MRARYGHGTTDLSVREGVVDLAAGIPLFASQMPSDDGEGLGGGSVFHLLLILIRDVTGSAIAG